MPTLESKSSDFTEHCGRETLLAQAMRNLHERLGSSVDGIKDLVSIVEGQTQVLHLVNKVTQRSVAQLELLRFAIKALEVDLNLLTSNTKLLDKRLNVLKCSLKEWEKSVGDKLDCSTDAMKELTKELKNASLDIRRQ